MKYEMLTRKQCRQHDEPTNQAEPEVLNRSKLHQNLVVPSAPSVQIMSAKKEVGEVFNQPSLQEKLAVVQDSFSKTSSVKQELVDNQHVKHVKKPVQKKRNLFNEKSEKPSTDDVSETATKYEILTRKKCRQQDVPKVLDNSQLQQNLAPTSALFAQSMPAISTLSKKRVEKVNDQLGAQDQISIMANSSSKTHASISAPVKEKVVSKQVKKPVAEKSSPAIEKFASVEIPTREIGKQMPVKGGEPRGKNKLKVQDASFEEYPFNSDDPSNTVAMTLEEMTELLQNILLLPPSAIIELVQIVQSRDPGKVDDVGEQLEIDIENLKPITLHEIRAFTDFYTGKRAKDVSVPTVEQLGVAKPPKVVSQLVPPKKKETVLSKSNATLPAPKRIGADFKDPIFLAGRRECLEEKLRVLDNGIQPKVQSDPFAKSLNQTLKSGKVSNVSARRSMAAAKPKTTRVINLPPGGSASKVELNEPLAAILEDAEAPPSEEMINRLREEERERRKRESLSNPSLTEQIELMEWMEAQI